ncbi:unnamed protein product [Periconia digitata]|uniref:Amino acid permease/ SLC12A domain-containing protein n=1 Tax=Periconia digitata TaxID=1303443 RepID=A0A9W4UPI1_9PLEO|nr:unnamed protein product [Periconia digitata]
MISQSSRSDPNMAQETKSGIATDSYVDNQPSGAAGEVVQARYGHDGLKRSLSSRHIQMIAIGSNIGTGLYIGTGSALKAGGPAALVIAFLTIIFAQYFMMTSLTEMGIHYPVTGSFVSYSSRFIDPVRLPSTPYKVIYRGGTNIPEALGFAVGWQYWGCWIAVFAVEATAFNVILSYWGDCIPIAGAIALFCALTCLINFLPVRVFGEAEFYTSSIKIISVIGFIIVGLVLIGGGGPTGEKFDGSYWKDPGPFAQGFHGMAAVFVTAAFATGGTEIVGVISGESASPRHNMPRATRTVWFRIFVFYVVTVVIITILVPFTDPKLLGGSDVNSSPLVVAVKHAGIGVLPDILNAIILVCVMSVGTTSLYASARMLLYLSTQNMAPHIFGRTDSQGRPLPALILTSTIGTGLSFLNVSNTGAVVFGWFSSLSGTAFFIFSLTIFTCNWRWRAAQEAQGINILTGEPFPYVQWGYPYAPITGFILVFFMLVCNGYTSIWPLEGSPNATHFFARYLGVPVCIFMWAGWKIWHRTWWLYIKPGNVDLQFERRMLRDHPEEMEILEEHAAKTRWQKALSYVNL